MAKGMRKKADDELLLALACCPTVEAAAHQCGVSERTAYRRLADPEFRRRQQELRGDMMRRATDGLAAAATEAVQTLRELLHSSSETTRLAAARTILQAGPKMREASDIEEQIASFERRLFGGASADHS
jgi:hypothetical protein